MRSGQDRRAAAQRNRTKSISRLDRRGEIALILETHLVRDRTDRRIRGGQKAAILPLCQTLARAAQTQKLVDGPLVKGVCSIVDRFYRPVG